MGHSSAVLWFVTGSVVNFGEALGERQKRTSRPDTFAKASICSPMCVNARTSRLRSGGNVLYSTVARLCAQWYRRRPHHCIIDVTEVRLFTTSGTIGRCSRACPSLHVERWCSAQEHSTCSLVGTDRFTGCKKTSHQHIRNPLAEVCWQQPGRT